MIELDLLEMKKTMTYGQIARKLHLTLGQVAGKIYRLQNPNYEKEYAQRIKERLNNRNKQPIQRGNNERF